jgi:hypothetical protein
VDRIALKKGRAGVGQEAAGRGGQEAVRGWAEAGGQGWGRQRLRTRHGRHGSRTAGGSGKNEPTLTVFPFLGNICSFKEIILEIYLAAAKSAKT